MKKYFLKTLLAVSTIVVLLIFGCKKPATTNPTNSPILVGFHFHTFIDTNLVDPALFPFQWFPDHNGRLENLEVAQFYISNISIHLYGTNTWMPITNDVMMKRINNEVYSLGNITSGAMDSVKFTVGLGNALNSQQPSAFSTTSATDSVLSSIEAPYMFGSGMAGMPTMPSGYTFINVQGRDSTDHLNFSYQIGGYGDTVNIALAVPGGFNFVPVLTDGQLNLIHIIADYGILLHALPTMNSGNTNSSFYGSNPVPANTLINAIQNMFRFECTPPINC